MKKVCIKALCMKIFSFRNVSIKSKITLWNAALMLLLVTLVLGFMLSMGTSIIEVSGKRQLVRVLDDNAEEIEFDDGRLELDDVNFFESGVYTLVYTQEGALISGKSPSGSLELALEDMSLRSLFSDGIEYYIYDKLIDVEDYGRVWVRGIIELDEVADLVHLLFFIALISLPFFVLFATLGCYFISKRAFRPIDKIINLAKEINESENLSLRINLGDGKDEVYELARTFDEMFAQLESSFEGEKQFSSDASHELRTPTAVILAQCEYARGEKATQEDREEALEVIQRQAFKMSKLINDLLNINRLDRGLERTDFKLADFSDLLTGLCKDQAHICPAHLELRWEIAPRVMLNLDQTIMTRLITNLLNNAFRYAKAPATELGVGSGNKSGVESGNCLGTVDVRLWENEKEIILSVEDNGIGIALDEQSKIWQRFYQVNPSRTAEQNGSMGLGLFMTKQIAKMHGAQITVKSELNVGTCFTVTFSK